MKAVYGKVFQVKDVPSGGVTRVVIEIPIENHVEATAMLYGQDVLVTLSPQGFGRYGIVQADDDAGAAGEEPAAVDAPASGKAMWAGELYRAGWFLNPRVLAAFGSDLEFLAWVKTQPCAIASIKAAPCSGDIVAAHVRRVSNGSGTGTKPQYSAIPLCDGHHKLQHQHGESVIGGNEAIDSRRAHHLAEWIKSCLYEQFDVSSLTEISQEDFVAYCDVLGIKSTLPSRVVA